MLEGWECDKCKEVFYNRAEIVFLCGGVEVEDEEHGGSGDIDKILCNICYDEISEEKLCLD